MQRGGDGWDKTEEIVMERSIFNLRSNRRALEDYKSTRKNAEAGKT